MIDISCECNSTHYRMGRGSFVALKETLAFFYSKEWSKNYQKYFNEVKRTPTRDKQFNNTIKQLIEAEKIDQPFVDFCMTNEQFGYLEPKLCHNIYDAISEKTIDGLFGYSESEYAAKWSDIIDIFKQCIENNSRFVWRKA